MLVEGTSVDDCTPACAFEGLYLPHPQDCTKFYICDGSKKAVEFSCQEGLLYDMILRRCEWPQIAYCIAGPDHKCDEILEVEPTDDDDNDETPTTTVPAQELTTVENPVEEDCTPPCQFSGLYLPHPQDCTKFYICDGGKNAVEFSCQEGLYYNMNRRLCDWPYSANCIAGPDHACDELLHE